MQLRVDEYQELEETIYASVVEPGLEVYLLPKKGYRKKYAIFSTKFGSIDSHFIVETEKGKKSFVFPWGSSFLEQSYLKKKEAMPLIAASGCYVECTYQLYSYNLPFRFLRKT